jgi:hypothetical protein
MFTKTKIAAGLAALAIGVTAFASTGQARSPYYYWDWGWGVPVGYAPVGYAPVGYAPVGYAPVGYASYVVQTRHGPRVCHRLAEYTDWGFYVGDSYVCSRR